MANLHGHEEGGKYDHQAVHRFERTPTIPVAVVLAVVGAVGLFRQTVVPAYDSLWAEDGMFLTEVGGPLDPYRGYFHVLPRLLARFVVLFSPDFWPWAVAILATTVAVSVGWFVYHASEPLIESADLRLVLAVWLVLAPIAVVPHNLANLHWYLLVGAFWAMHAPDRLQAGGIALTAAAAASNPITVLVGVVGLLRRRWLLASIALVGSSAHLLVGNTWDEVGGSWEPAVTYWLRSTLVVFGGDKLSLAAMSTVPALAAITAAITIVAARSQSSLFAWSSVGLSVAVCILAAVGRSQRVDMVWPFGNIRYVFLPAALMLGLLLASKWGRAVAVVVVLSLVVGYPIDSRSSAPRWSDVVAECSQPIPIAPNGSWYVDCENPAPYVRGPEAEH